MAQEMLRRGSNNDTVTQLQQILFPQSPEEWDGSFGAKTESAVKGFQQAHGLSPDGIVGPLTAAVINAIGPQILDPEGFGVQNPAVDAWAMADAGSLGVDYPEPEPFFALPETPTSSAPSASVDVDEDDPVTVPTPNVDVIDDTDGAASLTPASNTNEVFEQEINKIFVDDLPLGTGDINAEFAYDPQDYDPLSPTSDDFVVNADTLTASGMMSEYLDFFGLGPNSDTDLSAFVTNMVQQGMPVPAVLSQLRMTPEYGVRFPAQQARREAGLAPLSETEYINLETGYRQLASQAGIDPLFVDSADITRLLTNDVSLNEWQSRIALAEDAASSADPETIATIKEMYQFEDGDITALYLESDKIKNLVDARRKLTGAGLATRADTILGTTTARNVKADLGSLLQRANVQERELASTLTPLAGLSTRLLNEDAMSGGTLTRGAFNLDPASAAAVERRRQSRLTPLTGSSGAMGSQGGISSLGSAT